MVSRNMLLKCTSASFKFLKMIQTQLAKHSDYEKVRKVSKSTVSMQLL